MKNESKLRLLSILSILNEESDEEHPLTTQDLINKLKNEYEIPAHRTTVGNDIDILIQFGHDIVKVESTSNKYYVASRTFDAKDIKLMIDAIQSAKFISNDKADEMSERIPELLCSKPARKDLKRNIISEGRMLYDASKLLSVIDVINEAINTRRKISFKYFCYTVDSEIAYKNQGCPYRLSPFSIVWNGEFFYLVGESDKHERTIAFRVDRIADLPTILNEESDDMPDELDIEVILKSSFSMYNSKIQEVTLLCDRSAMDAVFDRFGMDVRTMSNGTDKAKIRVNAAISPVFFSWVFGHGGKIEIVGPRDVKLKYREMVSEALAELNKDK